MPITKSAKKALRNSRRKRVFNSRRKEAIRRAVKDVEKLGTGGKNEEVAQKLSIAYKAIDKAAKRGILKKNTAARNKSRLAHLFITTKKSSNNLMPSEARRTKTL